jgi:hypothetical protein
MAKLSTDLEAYFFGESAPEVVTLQELLKLSGDRTFGFLLVMLSFPSALPVPAPGYSTPFGLLILLLAVQMLWGRHEPWLPFRERSLKLSTVQRILKAGLPWLKRIEYVARPRWSGVCETTVGQFILAIAVSLMAISMILPIPGTNTLPAMGIFVVGFGILEKDGLISLLGLLLCLCGLILTTSIIIALIWGGVSLLDVLRQWLRR